VVLVREVVSVIILLLKMVVHARAHQLSNAIHRPAQPLLKMEDGVVGLRVMFSVDLERKHERVIILYLVMAELNALARIFRHVLNRFVLQMLLQHFA